MGNMDIDSPEEVVRPENLCGAGGGGEGRRKKGGDRCERGGGKMSRSNPSLGLDAGAGDLGETSSNVDEPLPENQTLGEAGTLVFLKIATACQNFTQNSTFSTLVRSVLRTMVQGQVTFMPGFGETSWESLRCSCDLSERLEVSSGLVHILALMRYRIQVEM